MLKNELLSGVTGAIFDLDGTLVDSLGIWGEIDIEFFHRHGKEVPADYQLSIAHMSFRQMANYTKERFGFPESVEEIEKTWVDMSEKAYATSIKAKPYAPEFIHSLKEKGIPISLATSNQRALYEPCLKNNGMFEDFDFFLNVNEIHSSKSEPTIYLSLAQMMKSEPKNTLVFEDILMAVRTSHTAGFRTVGVYDAHSALDREEIEKNSDGYIRSFKELM
jgi:HAD superfamily hydrolase (TIGR01509 family)